MYSRPQTQTTPLLRLYPERKEDAKEDKYYIRIEKEKRMRKTESLNHVKTAESRRKRLIAKGPKTNSYSYIEYPFFQTASSVYCGFMNFS
jgi:hypothetical protein